MLTQSVSNTHSLPPHHSLSIDQNTFKVSIETSFKGSSTIVMKTKNVEENFVRFKRLSLNMILNKFLNFQNMSLKILINWIIIKKMCI